MTRIAKKLLAAALLISMMGIASAAMMDTSKGEESGPQGAIGWICPPNC